LGELTQTIDPESKVIFRIVSLLIGGSLLALTDVVIAQIDAEIAKLQQAKVLLSGAEAPKSGRGRPKGSKNATAAAAPASAAGKSKRKLTPEGRKAIADAMKRRWAERRKQTGK
jgi:hypothetical protein